MLESSSADARAQAPVAPAFGLVAGVAAIDGATDAAGLGAADGATLAEDATTLPAGEPGAPPPEHADTMAKVADIATLAAADPIDPVRARMPKPSPLRARRDANATHDGPACLQVGARERARRLTEWLRGPTVGWQSPAPGSHFVVRCARWIGIPSMARTSFSAPEAHIVVSTDGYFDVYPASTRTNGDKPAYRGRLAELGAGIRGIDDRLAVRPDSIALSDAVTAWAAVNGAAALAGGLGKGRDGNEVAA